jgi:ATP/maltotriose-dependent transcriptional regulator MalT
LDENYGIRYVNPSVKISTVKNKGKYDDLEKASVYVSTNLRKLNPENPAMTAAGMAGIQKGTDIWKDTLTKIQWKDKKSDFNAKIGTYIYFNLVRLNIALGDKKEAEKMLNELQENIVNMDLSYDENAELKEFESAIYKN